MNNLLFCGRACLNFRYYSKNRRSALKNIALKHLTLIMMWWLLSLLFGCGGRQSNKPKQDLPWFPETDNPTIQVMEIPLDSGYTMQTFLVAPQRKEVYILAHTEKFMIGGHKRHEYWRSDYLLMRLDAQGQIVQRRELPNSVHSDPAYLWLEDQALVLFLNDKTRLFDAESLKPVEEIPYYYQGEFPGVKKLEELFPEEQLELYLPAREQALKKSTSTHILNLPKAGGAVLLLQNANKKRSLWTIQDSIEFEEFNKRYSTVQPEVNSDWKYNPETGLYRAGDGSVVLETIKEVSMGTQLDYPNYKQRYAMQYDLLLQGQKTRFATNNRSRKPLYVQISQNDYLSASGKEAWIGYRGVLYRLE